MENPQANEDDLKKRLLKRAALALILLAGLIGSLAIFDQLNAPAPAPEKLADATPPVSPPVVAPPVSMATPEATKEAAPVPDESVPERSAAVESAALPPLPAEKPLTRPASARVASLQPTGPRAAAEPRPDPVRDRPFRPLSQTAERPFALQVGVFNNTANAEELRAKLEKQGIPVTIETRVRIGPFATRAEADAARGKLKELGIAESVLISMKGRKSP
ncbi:MAG: SPOR domain-containing protein [Sulfuritalea sp.]|nr:SPOR domain-containing protein [Sulfuritalea sp.]